MSAMHQCPEETDHARTGHAPCRSCRCPDADTAYYVLDGHVLHVELLCGRHRNVMAGFVHVRLLGEVGTEEAEERVKAWLSTDGEEDDAD